MGVLSQLWAILGAAFTLVVLVCVVVMVFDVISVCDEKNLQTKEIIVVNKFIVNKGLDGDYFYFLDEEGVDYRLRGGHEGARYTKLKRNQSYRIGVNVELGNISCKEVLVERGDKI